MVLPFDMRSRLGVLCSTWCMGLDEALQCCIAKITKSASKGSDYYIVSTTVSRSETQWLLRFK